MKKIFVIFFSFSFFLFFPFSGNQLVVNPIMAAPAISNITQNSGSVAKYEKLEITFNITNTVAKNLNFSYAPYTADNPYPNASNFVDLKQGDYC